MSEGASKNLNTKATVAGGGAGTLLVALGNYVAPDNAALGKILTFAAPSVSVAAAASWILLARVAVSWRSWYIADRSLKRARKMRDAICSDPSASEGHKEHARATVEDFEQMTMAMMKADFKTVEVKLQP